MAYEEVSRVGIKEVLRQWQGGRSQRAISGATSLSRNTISKYILAAEQSGLRREGPPPTEEQVTGRALQNIAGPRKVVAPTEGVLEPWGDQIHTWFNGDRLLLTRIQELLTQRGCLVSYTSIRRFVTKRKWIATP